MNVGEALVLLGIVAAGAWALGMRAPTHRHTEIEFIPDPQRKRERERTAREIADQTGWRAEGDQLR